MRFKKEIAMAAALLFSMAAENVVSAAKIENNIRNEVLRFHIPANSDSESDQNIKLEIRDEILKKAQNEKWFADCSDLDAAKNDAAEHLSDIENIADRILNENGFDYDASAEICEMDFDERTYGDYTFPQGEYTALRVTLGSGNGHNWWCVMYPEMCIPYAEKLETDGKTAETFFDENEKKILKNPEKYRFKFKIAEIFEKLINVK